MKTSDCPTELVLREWVADRLDKGISADLERHVGECPMCQQVLCKIESASNIAPHMRSLKQTDVDTGHLSEAMTRAKLLRKVPMSTENQSGADETKIEVVAFPHDRFELLELIGKGGSGIVYKAREKSLDRMVAVKVLSPQLCGDPSSRDRFLREARSVAKVIHPNVITVHAVSEKSNVPYLVMEFVEGVSLQQRLDDGTPITMSEVIRIGRQIAQGLTAAHDEGVIHRDIKPGNILLNANSGNVLIGDFGLARVVDQSRLTRTGTLVGTPAYIAPEALESADSADHRSDLFSLGVVLYAMCAGQSPFQSETLIATLRRLSLVTPEPLSQKANQVPEFLSAIVMRLLEKNPADRFQSAAEVDQALADRVASSVPRIDVDRSSPVADRTVPNPSGGSSRRWILGAILAAGFSVVFLSALSISGMDWARRSAADVGPERAPDALTQPPPSSLALINEQPFVCVGQNGVITGRYESLEEAIENGGDGAIEIRSNEDFEIRQCLIQTAGTLLRAGKGYAPTFIFRPDPESDLHAMFVVECDLTIQGIHLHLPEHLQEDDFALIRVETPAHLHLVDCDLSVEDLGPCVICQSSLSIENCRCRAPRSTVLVLDPQGSARATIENSWMSGRHVVDAARDSHQFIELVDCTLACNEFLNTDVPEEDQPRLNIRSSRSLFLCFSGMIVTDSGYLDPQITWDADGNVYAGTWFADGGFDAWTRRFPDASSRYEENPFEFDIDELSGLITDPDFGVSELERIETVSAGAHEISR